MLSHTKCKVDAVNTLKLELETRSRLFLISQSKFTLVYNVLVNTLLYIITHKLSSLHINPLSVSVVKYLINIILFLN